MHTWALEKSLSFQSFNGHPLAELTTVKRNLCSIEPMPLSLSDQPPLIHFFHAEISEMINQFAITYRYVKVNEREGVSSLFFKRKSGQ